MHTTNGQLAGNHDRASSHHHLLGRSRIFHLDHGSDDDNPVGPTRCWFPPGAVGGVRGVPSVDIHIFYLLFTRNSNIGLTCAGYDSGMIKACLVQVLNINTKAVIDFCHKSGRFLKYQHHIHH